MWEPATFTDWSRRPQDPAYDRCSPNLRAILTWAINTWGLTSLGCYGERPVRGGYLPSPHSHGAAIDLSYGPGDERRDLFLGVIVPTLIRNRDQLAVQAIHDYVGNRIWRVGRTADPNGAEDVWWRRQTTGAGMGSSWATYMHVETTLQGWAIDTPIDDR